MIFWINIALTHWHRNQVEKMVFEIILKNAIPFLSTFQLLSSIDPSAGSCCQQTTRTKLAVVCKMQSFQFSIGNLLEN